MAKAKKISSFEQRLRRQRILHPEWSDAELMARVKASYQSSDPEKRAKQRAVLTPGNSKALRATAKVKRQAKALAQSDTSALEGMNIIDFAEQVCGIALHPAQAVVLKCLYGLPLDPSEMPLYGQITGGLTSQHEPGRACVEAVLAVGARSGKSLMLSIMALYECTVNGNRWRKHVRASETAYALIVATRLQQATDIILGNAARIATESPILSQLLDSDPTATRIEFKNHNAILAIPCNSTAGRGLPIFFLAFDEVAHFFTEGVKADTEIYNSLSPRLAQFPGAKTVLASTPAAKQGLFHEWFSEGFQVPGRHTFQGGTRLFNPTVDRDYLERQRRRDEDNYLREFEAQFAERMSAYFEESLVSAALSLPGDVAPVEDAQYLLAIDQSGLSGKDRFGAAVSHQDADGLVIVDAVRSWDSRDLEGVMAELAALARAYRVKTCLRDQYGAGWVASSLSKVGLESETRPALPIVFANLKALLLAGRVRLQDEPELKAGLLNTQAAYGKNNSMSIVHQRGSDGHADLADAVASACWSASQYADPSGLVFAPSMVDAMVTTTEAWGNE